MRARRRARAWLVAAAVAAATGLGVNWAVRPGAAIAPHRAGPSRIEGNGYPKILIDPSGLRTILERPPQRIASVTLATDEILYHLAPERLIAVTRMIDDASLSRDAGRVPSRLARIDARPERILPLEPDLVLVANYTRSETVALLAAAGVPLLRVGPFHCFADVFQSIRLLGAALGEERAAEAWIARLEARIAEVERRGAARPRPRVLYLAGGLYTAGADTLVDELLARAGAHNLARSAGLRGSAPIASELALGLQPEVVLVTGWSAAHGRLLRRQLLEDPRWAEVPAVRRGAVYHLAPASLLAVTHHAVDTLEEMFAVLHRASEH